jgi:uncharacterized FAD-dependent dehydrogenase
MEVIAVIRVGGLKVPVNGDMALLEKQLLKKLGVPAGEVLEYRISRESVDARKSDMIFFVYTVDVTLNDESRFLKKLINKDISPTPDQSYPFVRTGLERLVAHPVVVGAGPAGLFAALLLAQMGFRPLLLERGPEVNERVRSVKKFWETGHLDPEKNVQVGEGGAGTFSDGKLTTLIRDKRCRKVLEEMILAGAPEEILYSHRPHVGTDLLRVVVKNLRQRIIRLGGSVLFDHKVTDILVKEGRLAGLTVNQEQLDCQALVLAPGHSARDTFAMLLDRGIQITPKSFSVGVRIEHPQSLIDQAQYKQFAGHPRLGPADYKLAYHASSGRSAYTFCMCPGGLVVAATSEEGCVVTNGMSDYARDGQNANSALLVGVSPPDFGSDHPLAGVEFQREWERQAFRLGGGDYRAPAQTVGDFLAGRPSAAFGRVTPTYRKAVSPSDLRGCLPGFVVETLLEAVPALDKKMHGFALPDAVLTGVETRSSSPIRLVRDESYEAVNVKGLYPAGEGAGYAGGIISAAVDGIRVAESIAARYAP